MKTARISGIKTGMAVIASGIDTQSEEFKKNDAAMRALVDGLVGKPVAGRDLTNIFRQCFVHPTKGTTGIDFTLSIGAAF